MNYYELAKKYYNMGFYNDDPTSDKYVGNFVLAGKITEEQFKEITGKDYVPPVTSEL